jgi:hypothetical protein
MIALLTAAFLLIRTSIWFVHGLTGNRQKTWTHEKTNAFWPEVLAKDCPRARVITYGYDADVVKFAKSWENASQEGLRSYGAGLAHTVRDSLRNQTPRPIYFIPHSLGGLVVEQALLECIGSDESLHNVYLSTKGVMFMGVPHLGSHLAKWGSILRKLIPESIRSTNRKALDALKTNSELCHELDLKFQREAKHGKLKNIRLFSFYETKPIAGMTNLVVPEKSAILKGDPSLPIQGDHRSMTRFSGPDDPEYCKVKGQLLSWLSAKDIPVDETVDSEAPVLPKGPRIQMQGATFSGNITGTVNAGQQVAYRDMFLQQGAYSTQQFDQRGRRGSYSSDSVDGEPSTESDSEDDLEEIQHVSFP